MPKSFEWVGYCGRCKKWRHEDHVIFSKINASKSFCTFCGTALSDKPGGFKAW